MEVAERGDAVPTRREGWLYRNYRGKLPNGRIASNAIAVLIGSTVGRLHHSTI